MASLNFEDEKVKFRDYYSNNQKHLISAQESFRALISALLNSSNIPYTKIEGRVKDKEECIKKFQRKYQKELEEKQEEYEIKEFITDLIGIRIVCLYEDDIEKIENILSEHFDIKNKTNKTNEIESTENSFGYKGVHLDLTLNNTRKHLPEYKDISSHEFEIQIRTIVQDSWSVLDHKIKYKKSIPTKLKRRINTLAALFELADREFLAIRDETQKEIEKANSDPESSIELVESSGVLKDSTEPHTVKSTHIGEKLNAFNFLKIAQHFFNDYDFESHKVDGFTEEVTQYEPNLSRGKFNYYMRNLCTNKYTKVCKNDIIQ